MEVEEGLTGAIVRECYNCHLPFVRIAFCPVMTCPRCRANTCYHCRQPIEDEDLGASNHRDCYMNQAGTEVAQDMMHQKELEQARQRLREELGAKVEDQIRDLFEAGPSRGNH